MSSTYSSITIFPGKRAGFINQLINSNGLHGRCACPNDINRKIVNSSNSTNIQCLTQVQRQVNAIKYSIGGTTQYGDNNIIYKEGINFLANNQPTAPFRNKF